MAKYLSKSTYLKGLQCPKALYLHKYRPELRDAISEQQQAVFDQGSEVGLLAWELFPGGSDAGPEDFRDYFQAAKRTAQWISEGRNIIYEAGFIYNRVMCFVDILVRDAEGWKAYEVKSSTGVSEVYLDDAALQYFVMKNCGIDLQDFFITHINNQYVRKGPVEPEKLFQSTSVFQEIVAKQELVGSKIEDFLQLLEQSNVPEVDIGPHCHSPYPCDFMGHCWEGIPEYSVFNLSNMRGKDWALYEQGIIRLEELPRENDLNERQLMEVEAFLTGRKFIDRKSLSTFLKELSDRIFFMDFETFMQAVPPFDDSRPYQAIPFQYSLHVRDEGQLSHFEFLAQPGKDPRKEFLETLLEETAGPGDILVYNMSFEKRILNELADHLPVYREMIDERIARLKDLLVPFRKRMYYTSDMRGSASIKAVLPALIPEMRYDTLGIQEGASASQAFLNLGTVKDQEMNKNIRQDLLEYCRMDTLAMVRILERLREVCQEE